MVTVPDCINISIGRDFTKAIISKMLSAVIRKKIRNSSITVDKLELTSINDSGDVHGCIHITFDTNITNVMEAINKKNE